MSRDPYQPITALYQVWSCAGCGGRMLPGEVAVFAERAGEDTCWHPDCFACCECGEILEDLLYYYR